MSKSLNNELVFKWEIKVGDETFELSDASFEQLMKAEREGKRLVKIGNKVINPAFISSSKKIFKQANPIDEYVDWSAIEKQKSEVANLTDEELSKSEQIKKEIRQKIKEMKETPELEKIKPVYKDEKHTLAVADVWEHLKSSLNTLKCPVIDLNWRVDKSITSHTEGRESHPVTYYTKRVDLGDNYDKYFWAEAGFIKCEACGKVIKSEIKLFNDYENEVVVRKVILK